MQFFERNSKTCFFSYFKQKNQPSPILSIPRCPLSIPLSLTPSVPLLLPTKFFKFYQHCYKFLKDVFGKELCDCLRNNFLIFSRNQSIYDFILISTFSRHCLTVSSKNLCAVKFEFEWFEQFHNTLNSQKASRATVGLAEKKLIERSILDTKKNAIKIQDHVFFYFWHLNPILNGSFQTTLKNKFEQFTFLTLIQCQE